MGSRVKIKDGKEWLSHDIDADGYVSIKTFANLTQAERAAAGGLDGGGWRVIQRGRVFFVVRDIQEGGRRCDT